MTIVDLLRHGETERPDVLAGRTDLALSDAGWRQFERQTANGGWDAIVSSPLKRAREAAERLSTAQGFALDIDPDWQEIDFGDWDGQRASRSSRRSGRRRSASPTSCAIRRCSRRPTARPSIR